MKKTYWVPADRMEEVEAMLRAWRDEVPGREFVIEVPWEGQRMVEQFFAAAESSQNSSSTAGE